VSSKRSHLFGWRCQLFLPNAGRGRVVDSNGAEKTESGVAEYPVMPDVLQIGLESPKGRSGGLNRYFAELVGALRSIGMQVNAIVVGEAVEVSARQHQFRVVASASSSVLKRLSAIRRDVYQLDGQFDLVDAHFALSAFPVLAGPLRGRPLLVHFQGPWADESAANGERAIACIAKRWVERRVYRRASGFVVLSHSFRRILFERYGVAPWDVVVIAPGVDVDRFRPGDVAQARAVLGIEPEVWLAVAVRRLVPRMGLDVLLDAWREVASATDLPMLLLIAGVGPSRDELEAQTQRLGLSGSVRFIGRVDDADLVSLYRAADVSVVPSVALEGYGLVVLESLATGTPVIASAVGGLSEALGSFDKGLLVPPGDRHALADRLLSVIGGTRPLPSAAACRSYTEECTWTEVARHHADLYFRILRGESLSTKRSEEGSSRPIRVVVIGHTAQLSGGELAISRLISAMTDVDVHVVLAEDGPLVDVLERGGATVEVLPMNEVARNLRKDRARAGGFPLQAALSTVIYAARLSRRLRQLNPDLVHTNTLKSAMYGGMAARAVGIPCLWHIRDRIAEDYLPPTAVRLVRLAARYLPTQIVVNSWTTLATLRLPTPRWVRVVYDGVPMAAPISVVPSPVDITECSTQVNRARTDRFRVAMVGRLAGWKGQDIFLRAFAEAFSGGPEEAVLVGSAMFGEDEYEQNLIQLVADLGIGDQVQFRGFRSDMKAEYERVDALVHASVIPEPFGQVVVEGMASGLAVVASNAGGPAEIITHESDGLLFPPGDVGALAVLLQRLADPTFRQRLGDQAERTAAKYGMTNVASQLFQIYQSTIYRGSRRPRTKRH
jgi:glycosyltransferase involved in cell wall biosynthesis